MRLAGPDQRRLVDEVLGRLKVPMGDVPAVCLLDTGVNRGHRLLAPGLDAADMHAVDPSWGTHDHHGHGTKMAGLALYGDLTPIVTSADAIELQARLESVNLLPRGENPPELYGALTAQAVARAEIRAPQRRRVVCLTATVADYRDRGQPSAWSAEIDALCSGAQDEHRRLLFAAAGNIPLELCVADLTAQAAGVNAWR